MRKTQVACSRLYISAYFLARAFFILLCSYRLSLIIRPKPGLGFTLCVFLCLFIVFLLLMKKLLKADEKIRLNVLTLSSALYFLYAFTLFVPVEKNIAWLFAFSAGAFFINYALRIEKDSQLLAASCALGCLFAAFTFVGSQLQEYGRIELLYIFDEPLTLLRMLFCFVSLILCFILILNTVFTRILRTDFSSRDNDRKKRGLGFIAVMTVGILLCWLPYYYAFYPGNLSPDSLLEIRQQLGAESLSNHHPYIHQKLLSLCLAAGAASLESGIGIYTAVQMLVLALSFALCVYLLYSSGLRLGLCCVVYCFFALFSVNAFYSVTVWKDVIHGAISLGLMLLLVYGAMERDSGKESFFCCAGIVALGFLFCTFRNNGWHAFLLGFPLYILSNRKNWKRLTAVFVLTVLLVAGYNHLLFDVLGIKKSASGEALSVPLQQIARTANQNPEEIYSDDFVVLSEVFSDVEALGDKYCSYISDPVKASDTFLSDEFDKDPVKYLKAWAKIGLRHPVTYVEAFLLQNYGYWYPNVDYWIVHNTIEANELGLEHREDRFAMRHELGMLTKDLAKELPSSILYSLGLMVWLIIISAVILLLKGQGRLASPLWIMAMLWLTTLASPVYCEYRYLYGLVVSVPLFLGLALGVRTKAK